MVYAVQPVDPRTGTPIVGMVGGGQLARMTHQAAIPLGQSLRVLAVSGSDPAALVSPNVVLGHHTDLAALRSFAADCDVLTFDHEHVPNEHVRALEDEGFRVYPGSAALLYAQDKLAMRRRLAELGLPVPPFAEVTEVGDVLRFGAEHGWPCVLKAARGGYDGRGVWVLNTPQSAHRLVPEMLEAGTPLLVEQSVTMRRELAALVARSPFGQGAAWPVVQTVQADGICVEVLAPAPELTEERAQQAQELALRVAAELGVVGVLAVELFETAQGLVVNELAMRPHNSGHWSMDGAITSQFANHLRAVLDLPLGDPRPRARWTVMANVLGGDYPDMYSAYLHCMARDPRLKIHMYGKDVKPGRKVGHVNTYGDDLDDVLERARHAADYLRGTITE